MPEVHHKGVGSCQTGAVTVRPGVLYFEDGKVTKRFERLADAIAERYAEAFRELAK